MPSDSLILFATSEIYPFSKTGGLGDVLGTLPLVLRRLGVNTAVVTPLYGCMQTTSIPLHLVYSNLHVGYPWDPVTTDIYLADYRGMPVYFISRDEYFDRRCHYSTYKGDYFDNAERFIFFCRATLEWIKCLKQIPAIIHCNDWHTALIPAFVEYWSREDSRFARIHTVMSIHNLAFQGRYASRLFANSGLPADQWHIDGVEFWSDFNFLKAGIAYADHIITVSPSYAREILTDSLGYGLQGILRKRAKVLTGILNGADYEIWDPSHDKYLPCTYDVDNPTGKDRCKQQLIDEMSLNPVLHNRPILGFIGRLRRQKGIDLLLATFHELIKRNVGIIVLGEGNSGFEERILRLMEDYPLRLAANIGYTEDLAHRIQAGCDILLMPSRYEPCGLTQMYALRYGTLPVATAVGGLRDTIRPYPHPKATGFTFEKADARLFLAACYQAIDLWEQDTITWQTMQRRAMLQNFSWDDSAAHYIQVYHNLDSSV